MVDDENIKTTVSPFTIREGEIKKFDGNDGYVSISQIIHKINLGHINDVHFAILDLINEFEFMTSRQIYFMLLQRGVEIKSQDKLNIKLEQMVKSKILTRYFFISEEGKGIYRVYCMEKMGKYLLNSREIECKWQPTDNIKPVEMIKKRLSGNQVIIAYMRKAKNFDSYKVKPQITAKMAGKIVKSHSLVKISVGNKSISLVFDVVRRDLGWETKFVDRMRLFKDFYDNFVQFDSGFEIMPQLILVCEDDKHLVEVFKQVVANKLESEKLKLYFTTALKQNSTTLDKSYMEFTKDPETGKYKANNVQIKLLG